MFFHYLTIAWRSLRKHPVYSLINLLGLTIGLACGILILSYVLFEGSYDSHHERKDRIFQLVTEYDFPEEKGIIAVTPTISSPLFQREFPEIESGVRMLYQGGFRPAIIKYGEQRFQEQRFFYADSTFFDIFSFPLLHGNPKEALTKPATIVLSSSTAQRYFGDKNPIGEVLLIGSNESPYQITGVMEDIPENTHFHCDFIASFSTIGASKRESWGSANYQTYFLLKEETEVDALAAKINVLVDERLGADLQEGQEVNSFLIPIEDIHFRQDIVAQVEEPVDKDYVLIFLGVAILILLIACINYMNLATARAMDRAKEVSLKKVFGAFKTQVASQFLVEAVLITVLAMGLGIILASVTLPMFNELTTRNLSISDWLKPSILLSLLGAVLLVSMIAGLYPAFIFSGFQPATVLKGAFKRTKRGNFIRKGLVVFQFSISITLIICTLVVQKQLDFMQQVKLGYDKDQILVMPVDSKVMKGQQRIKNEFSQHPSFKEMTYGSESPVEVGGTYSLWRIAEGDDNSKLIKAIAVDPNYPKTLGLQILAGSDFTESMLEDTSYAFLINENAANMMGYADINAAIGDKVNLNGREGYVLGVFNNFYTQSLREDMESLVFFLEPDQYNYMLVKLDSDDMRESLAFMEEKWSQVFPHRPFEYSFLDETYDQLYNTEVRIGKIFGIFATLAILIAALGLLGLSSYTILQRSKEISIRKVLGASVREIATMLSSGFLQLVGISFLIATPIAWYFMNSWLDGFTYKVTIGVGTILIAAFCAAGIGLLTVGYQSLRAGFTNPVDWLKNE